MDLSKSLRLSIANKGIKHKDLAADLGVHTTQITTWLKTGSMQKDKLQKVSDYFGIPVSEFVKLGE